VLTDRCDHILNLVKPDMVGDQCNARGKMIFISLIGWTFRFKIMEI
jgi:hypothetical protein